MATHLLNQVPADHSNTTVKHISFIKASSYLSPSLVCPGTDLAPIMHCIDEGAFGLCQLLVIAAPEAEGTLVGAGGAVKPACRVLAGIGEALLGRGTQ